MQGYDWFFLTLQQTLIYFTRRNLEHLHTIDQIEQLSLLFYLLILLLQHAQILLFNTAAHHQIVVIHHFASTKLVAIIELIIVSTSISP